MTLLHVRIVGGYIHYIKPVHSPYRTQLNIHLHVIFFNNKVFNWLAAVTVCRRPLFMSINNNNMNLTVVYSIMFDLNYELKLTDALTLFTISLRCRWHAHARAHARCKQSRWLVSGTILRRNNNICLDAALTVLFTPSKSTT